MKMRQGGAAYWAWLAAVLLGPFVPFLTVPLGFMLFEEPHSTYRGGDWRGVQAMTYIGVPLWAFLIIATSIWMSKRLRPQSIEGEMSAVALAVMGLVLSAGCGFAACVVLPTIIRGLQH